MRPMPDFQPGSRRQHLPFDAPVAASAFFVIVNQRFAGSGAISARLQTLVSVFLSLEAWPGRKTPPFESCGRRMLCPSHRNGAPHLLGIARLMGRKTRLDHLLLVAEARSLSAGSPAERKRLVLHDHQQTPPATESVHQRVGAPGVQRRA